MEGEDRLPGLDLVQAGAEALGPGLPADPRPPVGEPLAVGLGVELGLEDVGYAQAPRNFGLRFSRKASIPSMRSSVAIESS